MKLRTVLSIIIIEIFIFSQIVFPFFTNEKSIKYQAVRRVKLVLPQVGIDIEYEEVPYTSIVTSVGLERYRETVEQALAQSSLDSTSGWSDLVEQLAALFDYYRVELGQVESLVTEAQSKIEELRDDIQELTGSSEEIYLLPWIGLLIETSIKEKIDIDSAIDFVRDRIEIAKDPSLQEVVKEGIQEEINFSDFDDVSYLFSAADSLIVSAKILEKISVNFGEQTLDSFAKLATALVGLRNKYNLSVGDLLDILEEALVHADELGHYVAALEGREELDYRNVAQDAAKLAPWVGMLIEDEISNGFVLDKAFERLKVVMEYASKADIQEKVKEALGVENLDYTDFDHMSYLAMPGKLELLKDRVMKLLLSKFGENYGVVASWMSMAGDLGEVMVSYGVSESEIVSRLYSLLDSLTEVITHLPGIDSARFSLQDPADVRYLVPWVMLGVELGVKQKLSPEDTLAKLFKIMASANGKLITSYEEASELASQVELKELNTFKDKLLSMVKNPLARPLIYIALGLGLTSIFRGLIGGADISTAYIPAFFGYGYVFGKLISAVGKPLLDFFRGETQNLRYSVYNILQKAILGAIAFVYGSAMGNYWQDAATVSNFLFLPYIYLNSHVARLGARSIFGLTGYSQPAAQGTVKQDPNIQPQGNIPLAKHGGVVLMMKNSSVNDVKEAMLTIEESFRNSAVLDEDGKPLSDDHFHLIIVSGTKDRKVLQAEIAEILGLQEKYGKDKVIYIPIRTGKKHENYQAVYQFLQRALSHNVNYTAEEYDERVGVEREDGFYLQFGGNRITGSRFYLKERQSIRAFGKEDILIDEIETRIFLINPDNPSQRFEMYLGDLYEVNPDGRRGDRVLLKEQYTIDEDGVIRDRATGNPIQVAGIPPRLLKQIEQKIYYRDESGSTRYLLLDKEGNLFDENGDLFATIDEYTVSKWVDVYSSGEEFSLLSPGCILVPTFAIQRKLDPTGKRYLRLVRYDNNANEEVIINEGDLVDEYYRPVMIDGLPLRRSEFKISGNKLIVKRLATTEFIIDEDHNLIDPATGKRIAQGVRVVNEDTLVGAAKNYLERFTTRGQKVAILIDETRGKRLAFKRYNLTLYKEGRLVTSESVEDFEATGNKGLFILDEQGRLLRKKDGKYIRGYFIGKSGRRFALDRFFENLDYDLLKPFVGSGLLTLEEALEAVRTGILGDVASLYPGKTGDESYYYLPHKRKEDLPEIVRENAIYYEVQGGLLISEGDGFYRDNAGDIYWKNIRGQDVLISNVGEYQRAYKYVSMLNQDSGGRESYIVYGKRDTFYMKNGRFYERKILGRWENVRIDEYGNAISKKDGSCIAEAGTFIVDEEGYLRSLREYEDDIEISGQNLVVDSEGRLIAYIDPKVGERNGEFLIVGNRVIKTTEDNLFEIPHRVEFLAQTDAENVYEKGAAKLLISMLSYLKEHGDKYAMLQPEMEITNPGESLFANIIRWAHRFVLYGERVFSNVSERSAAYGKMVFNLDKYLRDVIDMEVMPWDTDSHDTLEAIWGGSRLIAWPERLLTEEAPPTYLVSKVIAQRWIRGDLKNVLTNHPFFKAISALLRGDFEALKNVSLGPEANEIMSTILYNIAGPTSLGLWLGLGLWGGNLGIPILPQLATGLFWGIMSTLVAMPNAVMPLYEKAFRGGYEDISSLKLLGWGVAQALVSTSVYLMNLIYLPVATAQVIWNRIRGKKEEWIPYATVKRMLERKPSLLDTYRTLWLAPTVGTALALTAGIMGNMAFLTWGSPIWLGSFILGPLATWYTGTHGTAKDFVRRIIEATEEGGE